MADRALTLAARGARTAELSPGGTLMGYERDGDMFVYDLAQQKELRLTADATPTTYNGHFDWVYEEEFGMAQAWNWSPDSRFIAYWRLDESAEPTIQLSDFEGRHPDWTRIRIPQPGDSNPTVKIGVVDVRSGVSRKADARVIPGALLMDPAELGQDPAKRDARLRELPKDRDIIFYCTCPNEASAAQRFQHQEMDRERQQACRRDRA